MIGVAAGAYHSMAILGIAKRKASELYAWGDGYKGKLGLGDERARSTPTEVSKSVTVSHSSR